MTSFNEFKSVKLKDWYCFDIAFQVLLPYTVPIYKINSCGR